MRRLAVTVSVLTLIAYSVFAAVAPLPALSITPTEFSETIAADPAAGTAVVADDSLPTAAAWIEGGETWSNDDAPREIASLTKLISVLVAQEAAPLELGSDGDTYVYTYLDDQITAGVWAQNGVANPFPAGFEVSQRDMLELILLESSNDTTISYVNWQFGSEQAFLDAAAAWASAHELSSISITEPTGLSSANVASVADMVEVARLVLADPLLAEIVAMPTAEVPYYGLIENTNPLLGESGVVGVKTGTTVTAGFNLIAARTAEVGERAGTVLAVTLGRADAVARADDTRRILDAAAGTVQTVPTLEAGERVGTITTWEGAEIAVVTADATQSVLLPHEEASRKVALDAPTLGKAGQVVGAVTVTDPAGSQEVSVITGGDIEAPGYWWKFTHPAELMRAVFRDKL